MRCPRKLGRSSITGLPHKGSIVRQFLGFKLFMLVFSSVATVRRHDTHILKNLAKEFNLSFTAFGSDITPKGAPTAGKLTLTEAWDTGLEPAPVTPTAEDSAPWQLLSGTIRATYNAHRGLDGADNIFVSPGIMTGNTGGFTIPCQP